MKNKAKTLTEIPKKLYLSVFFVLLAVNIVAVVNIVSGGARIAGLESIEEKQLTQNRQMRDELIAVTSFTKIEEMASGLGFAKPDTRIYVTDEESVTALR